MFMLLVFTRAQFVAFKDRAELLLRISFPNPGAACDLSKKFGCTPSDAMALLEHAASIGVAIVGFSFHVGSQVPRADEHVHAVERCTSLLDDARRAGFKLRIIDIGGGFPAFLDRTGRHLRSASCWSPSRMQRATESPSSAHRFAPP